MPARHPSSEQRCVPTLTRLKSVALATPHRSPPPAASEESEGRPKHRQTRRDLTVSCAGCRRLRWARYCSEGASLGISSVDHSQRPLIRWTHRRPLVHSSTRAALPKKPNMKLMSRPRTGRRTPTSERTPVGVGTVTPSPALSLAALRRRCSEIEWGPIDHLIINLLQSEAYLTIPWSLRSAGPHQGLIDSTHHDR